MLPDRRYEPKKEDRGWYFVEYHPPQNFNFANLNLTITIENPSKNNIILAMEKEAEYWLNLYPVPLFISAFDNKEDLINLKDLKSQNHLMTFFDTERKISLHWYPLKDEEIPNFTTDIEYISGLYSDFTFITYEEIKSTSNKKRRQIDDGAFIFIIIFGVIPFLFEIFIAFNEIFSALAFMYVLYKSVQKIIKLAGMWPKSKKEKEKEEENRLKEHYYYYCKRNPEGFQKLKLQTLEITAKERVALEAQKLKKKD